MSPKNIYKILDLTLKVKENGRNFIPLFAGEAGIGKSEIVQQWVKMKQQDDPSFGFLDLRMAYFEGPDLVGLPKFETDENGIERTQTALPAFWPTEGKGLILLEEPNRAQPATLNALMQLLTDRKIHNYKIPDGYILAACINPDGNYDVTTMDTALKNRFEIFDVEYDHNHFIDYAKENKWHPSIIAFLNSGAWQYSKSENIGANEMYIAPRNFAKLNNVEMVELQKDRDLHYNVTVSILGHNVGKAYNTFVFEQKPILAKDLTDNKKASLDKLKMYSDPTAYRGDMIDVTIKSILDSIDSDLGSNQNISFPESTLVDVIMIIPKDLSVRLLEEYILKHPDKDYNIQNFVIKYPNVKDVLTALHDRNTRKEKNE